MDPTVPWFSHLEMCIDGRYHGTDISSCLLDVNDTGVVEIGSLDEGEEIVVERNQDQIVIQGLREVVSVGVPQSSFAARGADCPATSS